MIALLFRKRMLVFLIAYALLSISALWTAPLLGRVPLPCFSDGALKMQSTIYCMLNRQYIVPELKNVLTDFSQKMQDEFPGTNTQILDANFPFISGFPLLPHLSHNDGRKVDLAFYYMKEGKYLPDKTRSPIGYFAFENGPTECPHKMVSLRWDLGWLQGLWAEYQFEPLRMRAALQALSDDERIAKIFIEPHLRTKLKVSNPKIRFQGCRAARHDDHIHIQL